MTSEHSTYNWTPDEYRRAIACVNACAGIPTEALEARGGEVGLVLSDCRAKIGVNRIGNGASAMFSAPSAALREAAALLAEIANGEVWGPSGAAQWAVRVTQWLEAHPDLVKPDATP